MKNVYKIALTLMSLDLFPETYMFWSKQVTNLWFFGVMMICAFVFTVNLLWYIWTGRDLC